jgi:LCP family protein required for cell wall assembly
VLPPPLEVWNLGKVEQVALMRRTNQVWVLLSIALLLLFGLSACGDDESPPSVANAAVVADTSTPLPATATATPVPTITPTPDTRPPLERTINILLLGSDRRGNAPNWRTDVMMIVAVDLAQQRVGVISIPRDTFMEEIPNHSPNRINVVDYLGEQDEPDGGGPKLLSQLIQKHMGIRIDYYLRFGFQSFSDVIDAIGGIEVDVECRYADSVARLYLEPGHHLMDGQLALKYVRSRYTTSDLDRARRQQQVIWAVRQTIVERNLLPRIPALYTAIADSVQTDIDLLTAVRLIRFALALEAEHVHSVVLAPPDLLQPSWRLGMSVFVADWSAINHAVQRIFERPPMTAAEMSGAAGPGGAARTCS